MRLLIGPAGSGKTRHCLASLRRSEQDGQRALWIVPDQFTYTADRLLLEGGDLSGTRFVRVQSFRRLAHLTAEGMAAQSRPLSDEGRRLLLRRLVHSSSIEALGPLAAVRMTPGFIEALAVVLKELKATAGSCDSARMSANAALNAKVAALCRLLEAYEAATAAAGLLDPGDWILGVAGDIRAHPDRWADQNICIDGFMSFTPEEQALLEALARAAPNLTVTLCIEQDDAARALRRASEAAAHGVPPWSPRVLEGLRPRPRFLPTLRTLLSLAAVPAARLEVEYLPPAGHRFHRAPALARLERRLFDDAPPPAASGDAQEPPAGISERRFPTPYHEVVGWARWIDARTRLDPETSRYRDMAILVRDLESYRPLVLEVFSRYRIPVYIDQRRDATAHPLLRLALSALHVAARGWTRVAVVGLLRNPLLRLPPDTVDRIENLSLEYGIEYERWCETDWEPLALPARETADEQAADSETGDDEAQAEPETEDLNGGAASPASREDPTLRAARELAAREARDVAARFFPALRRFCDTWRAGAPSFSACASALNRLVAAWLETASHPGGPGGGTSAPAASGGKASLFADLPVASLPAAVLAAWPEGETAQILRLLDETLAMGTAFSGELPTRAGLFARLIKDAFRQASIGVTPQSLDAVTVAEPRRARVDEVRFVILGGLTSASFPRAAPEDPLLSDRERVQLAENGLPLVPHGIAQGEEDPYLFYIACTRARERLLLTYPAMGAGGQAAEPSSYLEEVRRIVPLDGADPEPPGPAADLEACQCDWELTGALTGTLSRTAAAQEAEVAAAILQAAPQARETLALARERAQRIRDPQCAPLPAELCASLFPARTLHASPSQLEAFGRCPFHHFARYLLRLEKRPEATLTPRSTGSAVHAALERFFAEPGLPADPEEGRARISEIFRTLAREEAYRVFQVDPPSAYRWRIAARNLRLFIETELARLRGSRFQPAAVELSFGGREEQAADRGRVHAALVEGTRLAGPALPPFEIAFAADSGGGGTAAARVLLHGRIDRLDLAREPGGPLLGLVLDYKHRRGRGSIAAEFARGLDLQIAIYLLVVQELLGIEAAGGLYYSISPTPRILGQRRPEENPRGLHMLGFYVAGLREAFDPAHAFTSRGTGAPEDLRGILASARERIGEHAAAILRGEIGPAAAARGGRLPCEYCDFRGVCRIDAQILRPAGTEVR